MCQISGQVRKAERTSRLYLVEKSASILPHPGTAQVTGSLGKIVTLGTRRLDNLIHGQKRQPEPAQTDISQLSNKT